MKHCALGCDDLTSEDSPAAVHVGALLLFVLVFGQRVLSNVRVSGLMALSCNCPSCCCQFVKMPPLDCAELLLAAMMLLSGNNFLPWRT